MSRCSPFMPIATPPAVSEITPPGMKWWMWRLPTITFWIGPSPPCSRIHHVMPRVMPKVTENEASMLNSEFSRVRLTA